MLKIATAALVLALTTAAPQPARLFADGFEAGNDSGWSELFPCVTDTDEQAPYCPGSMDLQPWTLACRSGETCWWLCSSGGTPDACITLGVGQCTSQ
jgi:hypothetical protein